MPSQIGYSDSLKSVAGKVFNYLASITLSGIDGKTLTLNANSTIDQDLAQVASPTFAAPIFTSLKASGAEQVKILTYSYTLTAGDILGGGGNITIPAVTLAKIRSISMAYKTVAGAVQTWNVLYVTSLYVNSTTNIVALTGASAQAGDIVSVMLIVAI